MHLGGRGQGDSHSVSVNYLSKYIIVKDTEPTNVGEGIWSVISLSDAFWGILTNRLITEWEGFIRGVIIIWNRK